MSSGWGCQYLTKNGIEEEWCRRLKHKCKPGCSGCILDGRFIFSNPDLPFNENRKPKNREDNPLKR
jgi:hypothetical protein